MNFTYLKSGSGDEVKGVNPDADMVMDKLNSRETAANIKEFLASGDL